MYAGERAHAGRGLSLLVAHCRSLDPDAPSARERLAEAVGTELAHALLFALCAPDRVEPAA